jgi:predicted nucleotidyltransferase
VELAQKILEFVGSRLKALRSHRGRGAVRRTSGAALILFGSLARGDYHRRSDADFCVVLAETPRSPFEGYGL